MTFCFHALSDEIQIQSTDMDIKNDGNLIIANNGSLKKELQAYVFKNNLQNIVNFIGPQYGKDNIEFYNSIDIYVSTSLRDGGLAASVAEAMSCERLVIVSDNSENSKYIKNGYSGYLFENKNYLILAELIEKSYIEHHKSKSIAEKGREVILNSCNYYLEMTKVDHIYNKLIKKKSVEI